MAKVAFRVADIKELQQQLAALPEAGHGKLEELVASAEEGFYAAAIDPLSDWLASLTSDAPAVPDPSMIAWHLLCDDGKTLLERLREAVDRMAKDPSVGAFESGDAKKIEAETQERRAELAEAEHARDKAEVEVAAASARLRKEHRG